MNWPPLGLPRWLLGFALTGLLLATLGASPALAQAPGQGQDHIVARAWLDDPQGLLSLADVQKLPMRSYRGVLGRGYGESVIWLRLHIDPAAGGGTAVPDATDATLVLRIRPVFLDDVRVFDPLAPRGLAGVTGDHHHPRSQLLQGKDFLVPIERGSAPRELWLRLVSSSTRQIDVQALSRADLDNRVDAERLLASVYVGLVLLLAVWGMAHWLVNREALIGSFGLAKLAALAYGLCMLGYTRSFWPPHWPAAWLDAATSVSSVLAVSTSMGFHALLARELQPPRWMRGLHALLLALLPVKLALLASGQTVQALEINMLEVLVAPIVFLVSACVSQGWRHDDPHSRPVLPRALVLGFYLLITALLVVVALHGLAITAGSEFHLYAVALHGLLTGVVLLLMLQYRALLLQRRERATALALERLQLQAQKERQVRHEQEQLMTMLAHELKTPLATMHMRLDPEAQGSSDINRAIREMRDVIDRCVQATQFGDGRLQPHSETLILYDLLQEAVSACSQPARVRWQAPAELLVHTDRQLLHIVLNNLIENACKYAAADSPIALSAEVVGGTVEPHLQILLGNQPGPAGWPDPAQMFRKYYRSPHARRQAGTGLGLFLARQLAELLGGQLQYRPQSGQICFEVHLPLHLPQAQAQATPRG